MSIVFSGSGFSEGNVVVGQELERQLAGVPFPGEKAKPPKSLEERIAEVLFLPPPLSSYLGFHISLFADAY